MSGDIGRGQPGKVGSMDRGIHEIMEDVSIHFQSHMKDVVEACGDPEVGILEDGSIAVENSRAVHLFGYIHEARTLEKNISSICPAVSDIQKISQCMNGSTIMHHMSKKTLALHKTEPSFNVGMFPCLNKSFACSEEPVCFAHFKDLSTIEDHKTELEHKDNLCQAMCNASFDPIFSIDQNGTILVVNDAACSMFGYSREEFIHELHPIATLA